MCLQADLGYDIRLYAIATQGRNGNWDQWITQYSLKYMRSTSTDWSDVKVNGQVKGEFIKYVRDGLQNIFFTLLWIP